MKEALKLALEALKQNHYYMIDAGLPNQSMLNKNFEAISAIKEALAGAECDRQPEQEPVAYKIGQEVRVTRLTYGGAVYNNKREIINANQPPHKTVCIGRIVEIKQECENGAVIVKCEGDDKFLPRFHFYPQDNGPDQLVEVLEQPKKSEPVGEILLSCGDYKEVSWKKGKLPPVGAKLYTTPPQRTWVGLTDEDKESFWTADQMTHEEWQQLFAEVEAKLKEKNT